MINERMLRRFRPKKWTWLERDAQPSAPHITINPDADHVFIGGHDEEGRFLVLRGEDPANRELWVGDRRHWTVVPPSP